MSRVDPRFSAEDEQAVLQLSAQIQGELLRVVEQYTSRADETGQPVFGRWLNIHALIELTGHLMQRIIADAASPDEARIKCLRLIDQLAGHVAPAVTARPH